MLDIEHGCVTPWHHLSLQGVLLGCCVPATHCNITCATLHIPWRPVVLHAPLHELRHTLRPPVKPGQTWSTRVCAGVLQGPGQPPVLRSAPHPH